MAVTLSLAAPQMIRIPGAERPYLLGRTPVTNAEYAVFLATGRVAPPPWWMDAAFSAASKPVVGVNWDEAMAYCAWLGESFGGQWRLPTQVEWEHAACGGLVSPATAWGDAVPDGEIPAGPLDGPWDAGRRTDTDSATWARSCTSGASTGIGRAGARAAADRGATPCAGRRRRRKAASYHFHATRTTDFASQKNRIRNRKYVTRAKSPCYKYVKLRPAPEHQRVKGAPSLEAGNIPV